MFEKFPKKQSVIKSVQRGVKNLADTEIYGTVTITSVNKDKSILIINNECGNVSYNYASFVRAVLTSETTITFTRSNGSDGNYIAWQVIEYN